MVQSQPFLCTQIPELQALERPSKTQDGMNMLISLKKPPVTMNLSITSPLLKLPGTSHNTTTPPHSQVVEYRQYDVYVSMSAV